MSSQEKLDTSGLPVLECRREVSANSEADKLTVGTIFKLECPTQSFTLNPSKLSFKTSKPYQLKLLEADAQPDGRLILKVTSYQVGDFNSNDVILTDGVNQMAVSGIQFNVESVIDPKNPPKQPYGPFGGHILYLPMFYLWAVLGFFGLVIFFAGFKLFRRWQKKRLIEGLKKHDSRLSPQAQLHVRFRQLERQRYLEENQLQKLLPEVDDILRVFVIRQFKIPAHDWSDRLILNDFQKRFSFLGSEISKELRVLLRETRKLRTSKEPQSKDIEQLVRKIKRWADQVDRLSGVSHHRRAEANL